MFDNSPKVLASDEYALLKESMEGTVLVKNSCIDFKQYRVPVADVFTLLPDKQYITKRVPLCDATKTINDYSHIIFYDCTLRVNQSACVTFRYCVFVNCTFVGDWSCVSLFSTNVLKNCQVSSKNIFSVRRYEAFNTLAGLTIYKTNCLNEWLPDIFENVKGLESAIQLVPSTGEFICFKAARRFLVHRLGYLPVIIKLRIPEDAERANSFSYKCRASKAEVLDIYDLEGNHYEDAASMHVTDKEFLYTVGEVVYPDGWDSDPIRDCTQGIHFFMQEALAIYWLNIHR